MPNFKPVLHKTWSRIEWVYSQRRNTSGRGWKIAKSKFWLKIVRLLGARRGQESSKTPKEESLVIIWLNIASISQVIVIKSISSSNFFSMIPIAPKHFFKNLEKDQYFCCTGLLQSSKLVYLDVKSQAQNRIKWVYSQRPKIIGRVSKIAKRKFSGFFISSRCFDLIKAAAKNLVTWSVKSSVNLPLNYVRAIATTNKTQ